MNLGKKHSEKTKIKISKSKLGKKLNLSKEQIKHKRDLMMGTSYAKGNIPWNKGLKGNEYKSHFKNGMKGQFKNGHKLSIGHKKPKENSSWFKKGFKHTQKWKDQMSLKRSGENHHNFQNWKSREPYGIEFNNQLKEFIRKRDNYVCQECKFSQDKLGYKLHIHHIDYNKTNNHPNNLISLCKSCHCQTNYKREDWTNYFQETRVSYG